MEHRGHFRRVRQLFQFQTLEEDTAAFDDSDNNDNRLGSPQYGVCRFANLFLSIDNYYLSQFVFL